MAQVHVFELIVQDKQLLIDLLFEPSSNLHALILPIITPSIRTKGDLITLVRLKLLDLAMSLDWGMLAALDAVLSGHPRLGEKRTGALSTSSAQEQAAFNSNSIVDHELLRLNTEYESAFPGLRFLTFVNGRPRDEILEEGHARIKRANKNLERCDGIEAICNIAADRASKMDMPSSN